MGVCFSNTVDGRDSIGGIEGQKGGDALEAVQMLHGARRLSSQLEVSTASLYILHTHYSSLFT